MRTHITLSRGWLALFMALFLRPDASMGQTAVTPPSRITYQGYLNGGDGQPLATISARSYDVVFRVFSEESGGTALWAEQQTTTVDKGYFSVQLGEGIPVPGVSNPSGGLAAVFTVAGAPDRYVGLTVKGIGSNGTDLEILPRVRLLAAPFAYLAQATGRLVDGAGSDAVVATASGIAFAKPVAALSLSAPTVAVGTLTVSNALTVGGAGGVASSGSGFVESSEGSLRIISGRHRWTGTRQSAQGQTFNAEPSPGYSVSRISVGRYKVTFDAPFTAPPSVTATTTLPSDGLPKWSLAWPVVLMSPDPATSCREFTLETYSGNHSYAYYLYLNGTFYSPAVGQGVFYGSTSQLGINNSMQFGVNYYYNADQFGIFNHYPEDCDFQFHAVGP